VKGVRRFAALSLTVVAAGCSLSPENGSAPPPQTTAPPPSYQTTVPAPSQTTVVPAGLSRIDSAYLASFQATILVDSSGYPLYVFAPDKRQRVTCTGSCAVRWPPLRLATGATPSAGPGINASLLGSAEDSDGGRVVTYDDWPLYTYTTDRKLGLKSAIATGAGLDLDGGNWYVIRTDGQPVVHPIPPKE
jgi:predicted lipoprotein with Yx(FWY)xxD motif